ncbi:MAG: amidohydrolase family protein [Acidimicrobiia bacterium]|nr:amidohydrolase family protein [Acidimicrobiia bacterium]
MSQTADLAILHAKLITMDDQRRIFSDGAVAVRGSRIVAVGRSAEVAATFTAKETIDAKGGVVQPGFVDCHVHFSQHLGRGIIPDAWPEEREHAHWLPYWLNLSEEDANAGTMLACLEMVRNGTTTFCDNGGKFRGDAKAAVVNRVGLRGMISEVCWDLPPYPSVSVGDTDACLKRLERLTQALPKNADARIWAGVSMAGMGRCTDRLLVEGKRLADRLGVTLDFHQSFGPGDVANYRKQTGGKTAIEHFANLGILGTNLQLVHMIYTEDSEVALLAASRTNVVHCPAASTRVGMGVSKVGRFPEMVAQGVNVALGSDSGNYSDFFDVARQAYLASTIHREARGVMPAISAHQALEMATRNGARSLGMLDAIGSLEVGKKADIVIHSGCRPEWHPGLNVVNSLVYSAQSASVDTVMVDGEIILRGGRFVRLDEEAEYRKIDALAQNLHRRMGFAIPSPWPLD